jgi:hypothetical protein
LNFPAFWRRAASRPPAEGASSAARVLSFRTIIGIVALAALA